MRQISKEYFRSNSIYSCGNITDLPAIGKRPTSCWRYPAFRRESPILITYTREIDKTDLSQEMSGINIAIPCLLLPCSPAKLCSLSFLIDMWLDN